MVKINYRVVSIQKKMELYVCIRKGVILETGTITSNKVILRRVFFNAFFVMCFLEIMNSAASLIDSYFMGNYIGTVGMAAMGYARPFFSFVDIICGPLGLGMQLVCSHYIGK